MLISTLIFYSVAFHEIDKMLQNESVISKNIFCYKDDISIVEH